MPRTPIWKAIADTLSAEIAEGAYHPGTKLPTEAALSQRFGVNRHTVRHALSAMSDQGLVRSRRGAGVFVTARPTEYPIGKRVRFTQNLTAAGRTPDRKILQLETRRGTEKECASLGLQKGADIHLLRTLSYADGAPMCLATSVFPAERLPGFLSAVTETRSVTRALRELGEEDYFRASSRLTATLADASQALHLEVEEGAPLLRSVNLNVDKSGAPIEYGRSFFAGERVTLVVEAKNL